MMYFPQSSAFVARRLTGSRLLFRPSYIRLSAQRLHTVIALAGPTGVGKSAIAFELAKLEPSHIVSVDSVQVYRGFNVGSNKPSAREQAAVPHHLVDLCETSTQLSSADFARQAQAAVADICAQGARPLVVGGSTLWMDWLIHGFPDAPEPRPETTQRVEELIKPFQLTGAWDDAVRFIQASVKVGNERKLSQISRNDWFRLKRHFEIELDLEQQQQQSQRLPAAGPSATASSSTLTGRRTPLLDSDRYDVRGFFLTPGNRVDLYHALDRRCEAMLRNGFLEEVADLVICGRATADTLVWKSIGYRQAILYLCRPDYRPMDFQAFVDFLEQFSVATRNYAKGQHTWYRKSDRFLWLRTDVPSSSSSSSRKGQQGGGGEDDDEGDRWSRITQDIDFWSKVDRHEYDLAIKAQLEYAAGAAEEERRRLDRKAARKLKRHPRRKHGVRAVGASEAEVTSVGDDDDEGDASHASGAGSDSDEAAAGEPGDDMEIPSTVWQDGHLDVTLRKFADGDVRAGLRTYSQVSAYTLFDSVLYKKYRDKDSVLRSHPSFRDLRAMVRLADRLCDRLRADCPPERLSAFFLQPKL